MFETEKDQKITVLGKTFNSEEGRREYFREELRKHLPELKNMEGFPIGEDEDILNLSDPPYYTACPNPWINDFIAEWEEEKKQLEKDGKINGNFKVNEPYASDVTEGRSNPVYNAHNYPTKVPHPAIMRYLLHYTQQGDIVFDGFGGSGMTGVAARMCGQADQNLKIKLGMNNENSGTRHAICSDLSPLGSFLSYNYNTSFNNYNTTKSAELKLKILEKKLNYLYQTKHSDGGLGTIKYTVFSDVFICSNCEEDIILFDVSLNKEEGKVRDSFHCSSCNAEHKKRNLNRKFVSKYDNILNKVVKVAEVVPVLITYVYNGKTYQKKPEIEDFNKIKEIENKNLSSWTPLEKLPNGYNTNQPRKSHGVEYVHQFYTKRNLITLSEINNSLEVSEKFLFTGLLTRSSRQARFLVKNFFHGGGGWVGTSLSGTLFIPSFSIEVNPFLTAKNRLKSYAIRPTNSTNLTSVSSATKTSIKTNSIDYIFTDPPFGANIMYSELNFNSEAWIKVKTDNKEEAIQNKVQNKTIDDYSKLMFLAFQEYYRILKPGKWMTVEFSNTSASVWNIIQIALTNSGFIVGNVAALDKKQGSFKAVTTVTAVKQDLVISCYKPSSEFDEKFKQHQSTNIAVWDFVDEHLQHLPIHLTSGNSTTAIIERSPKILFDRLIAFYVQKSLPVPIDAGKFQQGLRERFIERDGMFFTNEQVQEYDKKKAENPEFIQLSILVSSEQDGVLWLKNLLTDKSLTYQDIQPLWMQALAGVRKGDVIPELADILEENFLKDAEGKWYTPDPENEADLEKLRTKRLLKQFETYKTEAAKPKAKKIKEVRVEALRAGFKQCYQDKDFSSIVSVGDKIPNNLLMEDEVLLQFYDIASSRV